MLTPPQLHTLAAHLTTAAANASATLSRWVGRQAEITVAKVDQASLAEAASVLGEQDQPAAACLMVVEGWLTGQLIMACDDASGLALADLVLGRAAGSSHRWGELEQSAVLETANIVGCAFLNALARLSPRGDRAHELLPSPPRFHRDFAPALLQFALVNQAQTSDVALLTESEFRIESCPVKCALLFVPDAAGVSALQELSVQQPSVTRQKAHP
jgi:chemotaxis protein CheC